MADKIARVLNKRTDQIPPGAKYVGRPSKHGNRYVMGKDGTRAEVIAKHEQWIETEIARAEELGLPHPLADLRGQDLVCWCAPLPCHADTLLRLANA